MAQVSGTTDTLDLVGMAEDIEDAIFNISPEETPFLSMAKRKTATSTLHQWQTDTLASAGANRQVEGDDASFTTAAPTTMLGNYCQISRKTLIISRTADKVRKYGRAREVARLVTKYGKELKRDIEYALVTNQGSSTVSTTTARSSAGLESMIAGNRVFCAGTSGTTPGQVSVGVWTAPTDDSSTASLTEANLKSGIQQAWTDGGDPSVIMAGIAVKSQFAGFSGATKYAGVSYNTTSKTQQAALIGGVDVYVSDVGAHKLVLNRYMRSRILFGIDPEYVSVAFLDGIRVDDLAKTGDAEKKMLITEFCLVCDNPDAHFQLRELV
jgi:hypothetical protein